MKIYKTAVICLIAALCAFSAGCGSSGSKTSSEPVSSDAASSQAVSEVSDESSTESTAQSSSEKDESSVPVILESDVIDSSTIKFELDDDRPYDTLEDYLQSDAAKRMISKISGPDSQGIITTKIFAENNALVFERKFSNDFNLWLKDDFIENVKKAVEDKKAVFVSLVDQLESCINKKTITVKVRYVDPEGNKLYEGVFDNDKDSSEPAKEVSKESSKESSKTASQASKTA